MTRKPDIKKLILLNLPYLFAFYFVNKVAVVFRMAPGTEFVDKLTAGFANFSCPASIRWICSSVLPQEPCSSWQSA